MPVKMTDRRRRARWGEAAGGHQRAGVDSAVLVVG